ncbi:MAG: pyruvate kinase [Clostridia bacterium]|nr:pyruvate kinase [Clostridia bacterium]
MVTVYGTIGKACCNQEALENMLQNGMNGIRINLSHTSLALDSCRDSITAYRAACEHLGVKPEIMIDLQGPEIRSGNMRNPYILEPGDEIIIRQRQRHEEKPILPVPTALIHALESGDRIIVHDGEFSIRVIEELEAIPEELHPGGDENAEFITFIHRRFLGRAEGRGRIRGRETLTLEGKEVYGNVISSADQTNLTLAAELGVTSVMQPFVRSGEDIIAVREALAGYGLTCPIFAKIESKSALDHLDSIIEQADVVVIARGDLANAVSLPKLPAVQKRIAAKCKQANRPFMVVTQMLHSMLTNSVPTRPEVTDIFNAVLDGADYLMVTGETSVGRYPAEVIRYLREVASEAEAFLAENAAGTACKV